MARPHRDIKGFRSRIEPTSLASLAIVDSDVLRRPNDRIRLRVDMSHMHLIDLASEKVILPDCS